MYRHVAGSRSTHVRLVVLALRNVTLLVAFLVIASGCSASNEAAKDDSDPTANTVAGRVDVERLCADDIQTFRTDIASDGNRVSDAQLNLLDADVSDVALSDTPEWVVPYGDDGSWYVTLRSGNAVVIAPDGSVADATPVPAGDAPELLATSADDIRVESALKDQRLFDDPLPDARIVKSGDIWAALTRPTDRYDHGVLADAVEASAIEIVDTCTGNVTVIDVPEPEVIEGISPILADVDGDDEVEVVVTISNPRNGARLVVYDLDGTFLAESSAIGKRNRWRNQLAVAPLGPKGETEIVDVRVPHLGGVVEFFRLEGNTLNKQAEISEFTSHVIGTRNLDMGIVVDATGDDRLNVVVPTQARTELAVIVRENDAANVVGAVEVGGKVVTNISAQRLPSGGAVAVGSDGNYVRIWQTP